MFIILIGSEIILLSISLLLCIFNATMSYYQEDYKWTALFTALTLVSYFQIIKLMLL